MSQDWARLNLTPGACIPSRKVQSISLTDPMRVTTYRFTTPCRFTRRD